MNRHRIFSEQKALQIIEGIDKSVSDDSDGDDGVYQTAIVAMQ